MKKISNRDFVDSYIKEVRSALESLNKKMIFKALELLIKAYNENRTVFVLGNGGSASTAAHMAADFSKSTLSDVYDKKEKRLRVISLTENVSLLTAYGNDLNYEQVFVQQLQNLVVRGDVVIAISASGDSRNVINAVKYAKTCKAKTIGLLGFEKGGRLAKIVDCPIIVSSSHYGPVEDIHLIINHILASLFAKLKKQINSN